MVPGLGDDVLPMFLVTLHWFMTGLEPVVLSMDWEEGSSFTPKLQKISELILKMKERGHDVSLVGASAGGCAVINAFLKHKDQIRKVVCVSGRLRIGNKLDLESFKEEKMRSPAFADAVYLLMSHEKHLTQSDKNKILTTISSKSDHLVPRDTATIPGVKNIDIPVSGHLRSIAAALTVDSTPLIDFLLE